MQPGSTFSAAAAPAPCLFYALKRLQQAGKKLRRATHDNTMLYGTMSAVRWQQAIEQEIEINFFVPHTWQQTQSPLHGKRLPNSAAMTSSRGRPRWGDTLDDDDVLPPPSVKGPDDNGIKIVTEYFRNDKGDAIKKTCKLKVVVVEKKVFKVRSWVVAASRLSARNATGSAARGSVGLQACVHSSLGRPAGAAPCARGGG